MVGFGHSPILRRRVHVLPSPHHMLPLVRPTSLIGRSLVTAPRHIHTQSSECPLEHTYSISSTVLAEERMMSSCVSKTRDSKESWETIN